MELLECCGIVTITGAAKTARRCQSKAVAAAAAERRRRYLQAVIALVHTADDAAVEHISTGE